MNWKNKKVLVTGSEGMIGKELVEMLEKLGANVFGIDKYAKVPKMKWWQFSVPTKSLPLELTYKDVCEDFLRTVEPDFVFHLAGIKGNPRMTAEKPVDFMGPMLQFDTNMILASQKFNVKKFLYTSSIAVENPESDKYPAWAKQTAETLIEAMRIQYPKGTQYCIVRPANVYGRFDNLDKKECMVISDLIRKGIKEKVIEVWNDGEGIRDFINAKDCARGMIEAMEQMPKKPVNLCSGKGVKIKNVAMIIGKELGVTPILNMNKKDNSKRVMELNWKFKPKISIEEGLKETTKYMKENWKCA